MIPSEAFEKMVDLLTAGYAVVIGARDSAEQGEVLASQAGRVLAIKRRATREEYVTAALVAAGDDVALVATINNVRAAFYYEVELRHVNENSGNET